MTQPTDLLPLVPIYLPKVSAYVYYKPRAVYELIASHVASTAHGKAPTKAQEMQFLLDLAKQMDTVFFNGGEPVRALDLPMAVLAAVLEPFIEAVAALLPTTFMVDALARETQRQLRRFQWPTNASTWHSVDPVLIPRGNAHDQEISIRSHDG